MSIILADRIQETTTTSGTGSYALAGAKAGYSTFASAVAINGTCHYCCQLSSEWEMGVGTLTASATLARTTILLSSNSNAAVNWGAGTKDIFLTVSGARVSGSVGIGGFVPMSASTANQVTSGGSDWLRTGVVFESVGDSVALSWTSSAMPVAVVCAGLAYRDGRFCAIYYNSGSTAVSTNGVNWTVGTMPSTAYWKCITASDTIFCALDYDVTGKVATSSDGITWTARTTSTGGFIAVTYGLGRFVAIQLTNTVSSVSTDGITWTSGTMPAAVSWKAIACNGSVFCAVAQSTATAGTSSDGITWTTRTMPQNTTWNNIAWNGTVFCALAQGTTAATSTDGVTWTQRTLPVSRPWAGITAVGSRFVITNGDLYTSPLACDSTDGITWTQSTMSSGDDSRIAVVGGLDRVITVGSYSWKAEMSMVVEVLVEGYEKAVYADPPDNQFPLYMRRS